jgi:hypothetical protein
MDAVTEAWQLRTCKVVAHAWLLRTRLLCSRVEQTQEKLKGRNNSIYFSSVQLEFIYLEFFIYLASGTIGDLYMDYIMNVHF